MGKKIALGLVAIIVLGGGVYCLLTHFGVLGANVKSFHKAAIEERVPKSAQVVVTFDARWMLDQLIDENLGLFDAQNPGKLREDLSRASEKYFGVDILAARRGIFWGAPTEKAFALVLTGSFGGEPKGKRRDKHNGTEMVQLELGAWAAKVGDDLVLGGKEGVQLAIDLHEGDAKPLGDDEKALEAHLEALSDVGDGPIVASMHLGELSDDLPEDFQGIRAVAMAAGKKGEFWGAVVGDKGSLKKLVGLYEDGHEKMKDLLDEQLADAKSDENGGLVLALTFARHKLDDLLALSELELDDESLTIESDMKHSGLAMYVGVAGVVAVPAFIKYMRRAKTTEAIDQIDKIYKGASNYYTSPRVQQGTGLKIDCQFPETQELTPDVRGRGCCGGPLDQDGDDRCDVNTAQWATPAWSALNFQMNDQHYFGYAFESSGVLSYAKFTASAHADLDCDGTLSTFERYGYGDETASHAECSMKGSSAFYKNNETE